MTEEDIFAPEKPTLDTAALRGVVEDICKLDEQLSECAAREKALRDQRKPKVELAYKMLHEAQMPSCKWEDGLMVLKRLDKYPRVAAEHWDKFKRWLMRNKYWNLAKIHAKTLQSILKERLEKQQTVPDYVEVYEEKSVSIRGRGKKEEGSGQSVEGT